MYVTKRQKEILDYITGFVGERGYAPTLEEIGAYFGLSSPATVYAHVQRLVKKGYLRKTRHQGRGLELVDVEPPRSIEAPVLGQLVAGRPIETIRPAECVNLPPDMACASPVFVLRVRGNSLSDELLADGDLLVVADTPTAKEGQTVVATLDDQVAIVGRLFRDPEGMRVDSLRIGTPPRRLRAPQDQIRGIVIGLLRVYR